MNILITGINGFVGSNLVKALKDNHLIYGLDIITPEKNGVIKTFTWAQLDELPGVDVVIHLAGKAHATKSWINAQEYFDVNTTLTRKMFYWYLKSKATKFIFFSSVKAAAETVEGDVLTEDVIPTPVGPYGESKIAAERIIMSQQMEINKLGDKYFYILRPCMIHGPGNKGNLNLLYNFVKKGIPWPLGAYENRRSFTSIDNLIFVILQLIKKNIESGIYNMGDDEPISTNELITLMGKTMNKPLRIWKCNTHLIGFLVKIGTLLHLPLNTERLNKLTENYVVSNSKLKKALDIDKMPVKAEDGLIKTIKSFWNG